MPMAILRRHNAACYRPATPPHQNARTWLNHQGNAPAPTYSTPQRHPRILTAPVAARTWQAHPAAQPTKRAPKIDSVSKLEHLPEFNKKYLGDSNFDVTAAALGEIFTLT
jgi:hypothetical protein